MAQTPQANPPSSPEAAPKRGAWRRRLGFWVGLALLAGSVVYVLRQRHLLDAAWDALRQPEPLPLIILTLAIVGNVALSGALFSLLMRRFGRVGVIEMQALIASATFINYLPLRPGMLGRIAYHYQVNGIRPRHTLRTIIESAAISLAVAGLLAAALLARYALGGPLAAWIAAPFLIAAIGLFISSARLYVVGSLLRLAEVLLWAARYWAAFALIGRSIGPDAALAFACVSVIATMIPLVSNGLGVREWAVGLVAPMIGSGAMAVGITAELVNRAAEIVVITALGLAAAGYLAAIRPRSSNRARPRTPA